MPFSAYINEAIFLIESEFVRFHALADILHFRFVFFKIFGHYLMNQNANTFW